MKSTKDFRTSSEDTIKKATKLDPIRKSGKERHTLYKSLNNDEDEDTEFKALHKRESVLDYLDDGTDNDQESEDEYLDDEDYDDQEYSDDDFDDEDYDDQDLK